jgi:hypothetical protein
VDGLLASWVSRPFFSTLTGPCYTFFHMKLHRYLLIGGAIATAPLIALAAYSYPTCNPDQDASVCNRPGPVWLQTGTASQQNGSISVGSGSGIAGAFNGDVGITTGKAIRSDVSNGASVLNMSNYALTNPLGFTLGIYGDEKIFGFQNNGLGRLTTYELCLNNGADCRSVWPTGGSGTITGGGTANYVPLYTSGSGIGNSVMYQNGTNIGIGTTGAGAKLQVEGGAITDSAGTGATLRLANSMFFDADEISTTAATFYLGNTASSYKNMSIGKGFYIKNDGNIGVGTTAPGALFDLSNTVQLSNRIRLSGQEYYQAAQTSANGIDFRLGVNRTNERQLWFVDSAFAINNTNAQMRIRTGDGTFTSLDSISTDGTAVKPLSLNSTGGNVGVNTTAPLAPLNVIAASTADQAKVQQWGYTAASNPDTGYNLKLKQTVTSNVVRWTFDQVNNGTSYPNVMTFDRGNVGIGKTDVGDAGSKLYVDSGAISYGVRSKASCTGVYAEGGCGGVEGHGTGSSGRGVYGVSDVSNGTGVDGQGGTYGVKGYGNSYGVYGSGPIGVSGYDSIYGAEGYLGYNGWGIYTLGYGYIGTFYAGSYAGRANNSYYWDVSSDLRLKDRISPLEYGLDELTLLNPIRYQFKPGNAEGLDPNQMHIGIGAQDLQKVMPEAVTVDDKGYLKTNADPIFWAMVNSIKELKAENNGLQAQVNDLTNRIDAIEAKLK